MLDCTKVAKLIQSWHSLRLSAFQRIYHDYLRFRPNQLAATKISSIEPNRTLPVNGFVMYPSAALISAGWCL